MIAASDYSNCPLTPAQHFSRAAASPQASSLSPPVLADSSPLSLHTCPGPVALIPDCRCLSVWMGGFSQALSHTPPALIDSSPLLLRGQRKVSQSNRDGG